MQRKKLHYKIDNANSFKHKFLLWLKTQNIFCVLNSNDYTKDKFHRYNWIAAIDHLKIFKANNNPFKVLNNLELLDDWAFGHISYDVKNEIENLTSQNIENICFPKLHFFIPKYLFFISNNLLEIHYPKNISNVSIKNIIEQINTIALTDKLPINNKFKVQCCVSKTEYKENVQRLIKHIQKGDIYEVNYCMEFFVKDIQINPFLFCKKLWQNTSMPFSVFYRLGDKFLLSTSPERYLQKTGNRIITQPIKGTLRKSSNVFLNFLLKKHLKRNSKEIAENVMIVDLARNDLSKIAAKNSVLVSQLCKVYTFKKINQMISTVEAKLKNNICLVDIIRATFPMGSMTGAPKIKAMELIEKYENTKRGIFSGTVGYITPNKDFDFNVVIRSILYDMKKAYLSFSVGSAITSKSIPEKEYDECLLKVQHIKDILTS